MVNAFERLLADLSEADVEYLLVGGLAVALCGHIRATEDVDILILAEHGNIARLLKCLETFGEGAARELRVEDFTIEEGAIRIVEDFPLDVFTQMSGYAYEDLLPYTEQHTVGDVTIRHLNVEGLLMLKSDSSRPKDQLDVQALQAVQREQKGD